MQVVHTAKKGHIAFGGHITSKSCALDLHTKFVTLDSLPMLSLDIDVCHHLWSIKNMRDERHSLMIANRVVPSIILPCPNRIDVRVRANWIYNLNVGADAGADPMDIHENVVADDATDNEYDQRERVSHIHQSPSYHFPYIPTSSRLTTHFSNHFAGTSSGATHATLDDILNEMHARNATNAGRDNLIYVMHQQQMRMMQHIGQIQTQQTTMKEHMHQMQAFQTNMTNDVQLIQATQASFLGRLQHLRAV